MRKLAVFALAIVGLGILVGCAKTEVDSNDVKNWQNEGREPGDTPPDPSGRGGE